MATPGKAPAQQRVAYVRHRPEHTLLYQIVEEHYPTFRDLLEQQGRSLPAYVAREAIATYQCRKAGFKARDAQSGAVTLIQRFGSALNLNPNAARSTYTSCSWMASTCIAIIDRPAFSASRHRIKASWKTCYHAPGSAD